MTKPRPVDFAKILRGILGDISAFCQLARHGRRKVAALAALGLALSKTTDPQAVRVIELLQSLLTGDELAQHRVKPTADDKQNLIALIREMFALMARIDRVARTQGYLDAPFALPDFFRQGNGDDC